MRRRVERDLFDQQLWCLGRDIMGPGGVNLLTEYGFARLPHPHSTQMASLYTLDRPAGGILILRGFGIFRGDPRHGGLFLRRHDFVPRLTPGSRLATIPWSSDDLPRLSRVEPREVNRASWLLAEVCDWLADYEEWVRREWGESYREQTIAEWSSRVRKQVRPVEPNAMIVEWRRLAREARERPEACLRAA